MPDPNDDDLLTVSEVAGLLRLSEHTIRDWRKHRLHPELGVFRLLGRLVAKRGDVHRFIEAQRQRDRAVADAGDTQVFHLTDADYAAAASYYQDPGGPLNFTRADLAEPAFVPAPSVTRGIPGIVGR